MASYYIYWTFGCSTELKMVSYNVHKTINKSMKLYKASYNKYGTFMFFETTRSSVIQLTTLFYSTIFGIVSER